MCRYSFNNTVQQLKNEKLARTLSNGLVQLLPKICSLVEWELKSCYLSMLSLLRDISVYFTCIWRMSHMMQVRLHIPFWSQKLTLYSGFLFYFKEKQKHPLSSVFSLIFPSMSCLIHLLKWKKKKNCVFSWQTIVMSL